MKYIYGPVKSRRLGLSLGITLTPYKICSFNCVYCQLGRTTLQAHERKEYIPVQEMVNELKSWFFHNAQQAKNLNYITLSGAGEPTLNIKMGEIIAEIKKITALPIAVITNASLLNMPSVRKELCNADLIVPSLDSVDLTSFIKIDRPKEEIKIEGIIDGLVNLRKEFKGKVWLEVMLVKGINDGLEQVRKLKEIIDKINPDKVQLNSPVRSTAEPQVQAVDKKRIEKIKEILGERCEII